MLTGVQVCPVRISEFGACNLVGAPREVGGAPSLLPFRRATWSGRGALS